MTVYEEIGLPRVINASGRVTVLGVSTISDKVAKAAVAGGQSYVVVEDLLDKAGEIISQYTGGEDSCPTVCASAAIALSVAGMISRGKKTIMDRLPDPPDWPMRLFYRRAMSSTSTRPSKPCCVWAAAYR